METGNTVVIWAYFELWIIDIEARLRTASKESQKIYNFVQMFLNFQLYFSYQTVVWYFCNSDYWTAGSKITTDNITPSVELNLKCFGY